MTCPYCAAREARASRAGVRVRDIWEVGAKIARPSSPSDHEFYHADGGPTPLCHTPEFTAELLAWSRRKHSGPSWNLDAVDTEC